jgi:uncharacterized protein YciI
MGRTWRELWQFTLISLLLATPMASPADEGSHKSFAVEIRIGPGWDPDKAPGQQRAFAEHSAHLRELREAGRIVFGSRYSDVGLLVIMAESEEAVRALMDDDPSMAAGTFRYDVFPMNIFYPWREPQSGESR